MGRLTLVVLCLLVAFSVFGQNTVEPVPMNDYLEFARASADWTWEHYDSLIVRWRETLDPENIFGYRSPPRLLEMATIYATLYELEGNEEYADRAERVLIEYGDYRDEYPEEAAALRPDYSNGVPALPDFFTTMRYIRPYEILKEHGRLSRSQRRHIDEVIAHSIEYTFQTQEWGAMNRAMLRAETLAWAVRVLHDHPDVDRWRQYEHALGFDNWGAWEIEDATIYHGVWLYSLLGYADAKQQMEELFRTPEMYYYGQYFLNLMCPDGMIPDFGDANWRGNWQRYLVFFEAAAAQYDNPELKWAASVIARNFIDFDRIQNIGLAYLLLDCYRYGTDDVASEIPTALSMEVMEDVQGKKIVFRNGWEPESTYMLLNYKDEGEDGFLYRAYLRDAIPVEEEKMTHGHSDENSIVLLMHNGSVLLHDGGYRDYMPSGMYGAYRQDYFHNRLCVRPEKIWFGQEEGEYRYSPTDHPAIEGQSVLDFLHNAGSYHEVRTHKVDFLTFDDFDYSRTRVIDDRRGYESDRVICYLKDPEMIVVFDIMKATEEGYLTASNLWHTRQIVDQGEHWYDTHYDSLGNLALGDNSNLLIYFPSTHYRIEQVEPQRRHYQDEITISQTTAQYFELGRHIGFATVLIPHDASVGASDWVARIHYSDTTPEGAGMMVTIENGDETITVGVKNDLRMDMQRDYRRPRYTWETGRIQFGDLESNCDFFVTRRNDDDLAFTVVNMSRAVFDGTVLFDQAPSFFGLAFDGSSDQSGVGKARYWRDEVELR